MEYVFIILLIVISSLLWKIKFGTKILSAGPSDWLILEWHKIRHAGNPEKASWDPEAPIHIEFVPILGWEYNNGKVTPITPPSSNVWGRLNVNPLDRKAEYETLGYFFREGAVFDIDDLRPSDFWVHIADHSISGSKFEVYGSVPDRCREKLFKIIEKQDQKYKCS